MPPCSIAARCCARAPPHRGRDIGRSRRLLGQGPPGAARRSSPARAAGLGARQANGLRGSRRGLDFGRLSPLQSRAPEEPTASFLEAGAEARASGAAATLDAGGSACRSAVFVRGASWPRASSRLAAFVAWRGSRRSLAGAALAGLDLPRAFGWLGVLAITSVSCRVLSGRLSPVLVIIGQYLSAKPTPLFGQKDVLHDLCRTRRTRRREDRIGRAYRPCRAFRLRLGCLCAAAGQHLETGVQGVWVRDRRRAAGRFRQQDAAGQPTPTIFRCSSRRPSRRGRL